MFAFAMVVVLGGTLFGITAPRWIPVMLRK